VLPPSPAIGAESHKDAACIFEADSSSSTVEASSAWQFAEPAADHSSSSIHDAAALATSLKRKKGSKTNGKGGRSGHALQVVDGAAKACASAGSVSLQQQVENSRRADGDLEAASCSAPVFQRQHLIPIEMISQLQDGIQASFISALRLVSSRVDGMWQRLSSINAKVEAVQRGQWILELGKLSADVAHARQQAKDTQQELHCVSAQLEQRRAAVEALGGELARLELAQKEAIEIESSVARHRQELSDLIRKQECLQMSFASLNAQYESMDSEVASRRDELRMQISALVEEKCSLEVALSMHHERLEAQVMSIFYSHFVLPLSWLLVLLFSHTVFSPMRSAPSCNRSPLELIAAKAKN
jgi:chromosome segregation ATPase